MFCYHQKATEQLFCWVKKRILFTCNIWNFYKWITKWWNSPVIDHIDHRTILSLKRFKIPFIFLLLKIYSINVLSLLLYFITQVLWSCLGYLRLESYGKRGYLKNLQRNRAVMLFLILQKWQCLLHSHNKINMVAKSTQWVCTLS